MQYTLAEYNPCVTLFMYSGVYLPYIWHIWVINSNPTPHLGIQCITHSVPPQVSTGLHNDPINIFWIKN